MIVGIIAAKENSNRFPGKNIYELNGVPLFWHSVSPLLQSKRVDDVYVVTDSLYIKEYCIERDVNVLWRPKNATIDEDPLLSIMKFAYYNLDVPYDFIVTIMANCPGHTVDSVDEAIELIEKNDFLEIRSFNNKNEESGLMIFRKNVIINNSQISSHIGFIKSDTKEIHFKNDIYEIQAKY